MAQGRSTVEGSAPGNLPAQFTSFVGRDVEVTELRRLLRERRLVTLTGAGGSGKTRLALEAARALAEDFPEGAFLVDLAPLARPELLLETAARVLGVQAASDRSLLDALAGLLCGRQTLLILDNCEHLLGPCATLARDLLAACPDLRVLATSREPLGIGGECTFRVPLLSVPGQGPGFEAAGLMEFEAVQLFVDRARLADPAFALSAGSAASVAQICIRLDGIPLALELAAAALRAMPVSQLAARLDQRFSLLAAGDRTALPRHQTLTALLDWSHTLLDEDEQFVFRRLAVFPGDWTLEAAEYVCSSAGATGNVLSVIVRLVNKSLVQLDPGSGRYRMLETVRLYALRKLAEAGEQESVARQHLAWYLQLAEETASRLGGPGQQAWFLLLESEQANLRAALNWSIGAGEAEAAARLALALWRFWVARAYHREARRWIEQVLQVRSEGGTAAPLPAPVRARLLGALGTLVHTMNEFDLAGQYHDEALAIWRSQGDKAGVARALHDMGWQQFQAMDMACARQYAGESLAVARQAGDEAAVAAALNLYAAASVEGGWLDGLLPVLEESLGIWRRLGVLPEQASTLITLARVEQRLGELARAGRHMLESLRLQVGLGDYGEMIGSLVLMLCFEFDVREASFWPAGGQTQPMAYLEHGRLLNGPMEAARVLGMTAGWEERVLGGATVQWNALVVPLRDKLRADMGEPAFEREFAAGQAMEPEQILALAEEIVCSLPSAPSVVQPAVPGPAVTGSGAQTRHSASHPSTVARASGSPDALTPREAEVLRLVATGLTNREIAERLVVTPRTVNAHLTSVYAKLGVTSRAGAVRHAVEHGLA